MLSDTRIQCQNAVTDVVSWDLNYGDDRNCTVGDICADTLSHEM